MQRSTGFPETHFKSVAVQELPPLCLNSEKDALNARFKEVETRKSSLLIVEIQNYFTSGIDLKFITSFMLCANALAMWKTCAPVTRLLVLSGDVSMQPLGMLYAFANEFRSLMNGGFGRIDNITAWLDNLGIKGEKESVDFRDFRRAVRVFSAARLSPDDVPSLAHVEWYFAFPSTLFQNPDLGHCSYRPLGSHSIRLENQGTNLEFQFAARFTDGCCEVLSSENKSFAYKLSLDLSQTRVPFDSGESARYLGAFASLI